jgi:serine/threonine protein kinase
MTLEIFEHNDINTHNIVVHESDNFESVNINLSEDLGYNLIVKDRLKFIDFGLSSTNLNKRRLSKIGNYKNDFFSLRMLFIQLLDVVKLYVNNIYIYYIQVIKKIIILILLFLVII